MAKVTNRDFVVAWACAESIDDVIKATDLKRTTIASRAAYLRSKGVNLPKLLRKRERLDQLEVAQLNSLIKKHRASRP